MSSDSLDLPPDKAPIPPATARPPAAINPNLPFPPNFAIRGISFFAITIPILTVNTANFPSNLVTNLPKVFPNKR